MTLDFGDPRLDCAVDLADAGALIQIRLVVSTSRVVRPQRRQRRQAAVRARRRASRRLEAVEAEVQRFVREAGTP